ncbi:MAG: glycosyltransferase family 39 protein [Gammaproteobacteria bacterium]|nr:glycosyltransferase family 39 protein [Gammaproteobacteria bacterium]
MPKATRSWVTDLFVLTLLIGFLYSISMSNRPLAPPDEGRYSEIPREMVATGDYITPRLNGIKYFEKPALFYWLQSLSIKAFGLNEWSLRLATELMGILGCLFTYIGSRKLYDRQTALYATLILASSMLYAGLAHFITIDMTVSVFLIGSLLAFMVGNKYPAGKTRRNYLWLMYFFAALATLTKGLIGVIFPGMIIFTWLCVTGQWRQLSSYCLLSGTGIFLIITLPWHILVQLKNPEFFNFYFIDQQFLRYFTDYAGRSQPLWFFPVVLLAGFFPWTGFLFSALKEHFQAWRNLKKYPFELFLLLWASLIFLFYWLSHSQLIPYILPIFAPLAILTGRYISQYINDTERMKFGLGVALISSIIMYIAALVFTHSAPLENMTANFIGVTPLFLGIILLFFKRISGFFIFVSLALTTACLLLVATYNYNQFETRSIKPLATNLVKFIRSDDIIYSFHHYAQDLPFYLGRKVKIVNWRGELDFGIKHQNTKDLFLNDQQLQTEWPNKTRKFMVLKKQDLPYFNTCPSLKYYVITEEGKYALICNQDIKQ